MVEYFALLITFLSALAAVRGDTWDNNKTGLKKVTLTGWLTVIFAVLGFIVSCRIIFRSEQQSKLDSIKLDNAFQELRQKNEEITELNRKIAETVTGGNSFCYLMLKFDDRTVNYFTMVLIHQGEYPLYDVSLRIVDLEKFENIELKTLSDVSEAQTVIKIGNLAPNMTQILGSWKLPDTNMKRYNIFIAARNGIVTQLMRLKRVSGRWVGATRVEKGLTSKPEVLYEKIESQFPRDKNGNVEWQ